MTNPNPIKGDRALGSGDTDKLGFRDVAKRIASALVDRASEDGLVVGIDGEWGSGKSSLLYLIGEELDSLAEADRPTLINFRPWLVGDRDALITSLFQSLTSKLNEIAAGEGNYGPDAVAKAKQAAELLRQFARSVSKVGAVVKVVGEATGLKPIEFLGGGMTAANELLEKGQAKSLSELKDALIKSLRDLNHRFVVTVDDVDRLEPAEVIEVLRLVRSVVDLPNVIYLLCFDSQILAHSIEQAAGIESGRAYLEKIVQLTVFVPKPEPLELRQWFTEDLKAIADVKSDDELSRLRYVIDYEGGRQLRTPRSVVRTLDSMRFYWPPLRAAGADLADLVWLQLIKDGNPSLYRWIETYCATASWVSLGIARVAKAESEREQEALMATVPKGYFKDSTYRYYFAEQLPGVSVDYSQATEGFILFQKITDLERTKAIEQQRLTSPDHYRLYFALSGPVHALTQGNTSRVWLAAEESVSAISKAMLDLYAEEISLTLTKLDLLLDRLEFHVPELLSVQQAENLLLGLANILDFAFIKRPFDLFWPGTLWGRAENLVKPLLKHIGEDRRTCVIKMMFSQGGALAWLTVLFRKELYGHGRYGDRPSYKDEWLLTNQELDIITPIMQGRYRAMSPEEIFSIPQPASLMYAWYQSGDEAGPGEKLAPLVQTNDGLILCLESLTGTVHSSHRGRYETLRRESLNPFMDYDSVRARVQALTTDGQLGIRAKHLAVAFEDGEHNLR
jgi:hypothetical protein